jgi:hypothetical protein
MIANSHREFLMDCESSKTAGERPVKRRSGWEFEQEEIEITKGLESVLRYLCFLLFNFEEINHLDFYEWKENCQGEENSVCE